MLTFKTAREEVRKLGFTLTKRDGEYRLVPKSAAGAARNAQSYYTNDLQDAVDTAYAWK